jgi:hypothetical protein
MAVAFVGVGAAIVHLDDIVRTGNLAPGNTLQNVSNLLRPALLVLFLLASRRADAASGLEDPGQAFDRWRAPRVQAAGLATGIVAGGFGAGFGIGQAVLGTGIGVVLSAILVW